MSGLCVEPIDAKHIRISGIEPFLANCLEGVADVLEKRDSPQVRERLFPDPTPANVKMNEDWQKLISPDLRHLFVSAGDIVTRDLTGLSEDPRETGSYLVTFPTEHLNAWMSALNEARLILGELFHITEKDLNRKKFDGAGARTLAIVRIHMLGYLLQLLVEFETGNTGVGRDEPKDSV